MRKFFLVVAVALIVLVGVAVIGPSLPEGNAIHSLGEGIREMVSGVGGGFGGGYQPITP